MQKMHVDEVETDGALVRRLLMDQFPEWAALPLAPVPFAGTDNALYRLGDELVVRLPRIHWATDQAAHEQRWLPRLAPHLPLAVPVPLATGAPAHGYPWPWSVYRWLPGEDASSARLDAPSEAARTLARFINALQQIDTTGGPLARDHNVRGQPLIERDAATREAIAALNGMIDGTQAMRAWEAALAAPDWSDASVWFHGDLLPGNVLVEDGRLRAVIDWSGLAVGDPACDLMMAWGLFSGESRIAFRDALGVGDATWARARGHALSQALIFIPYYLTTNPAGVRNARRMLDAVLTDE